MSRQDTGMTGMEMAVPAIWWSIILGCVVAIWIPWSSEENERQVEMSDNRIGAACWYKSNDNDWLPGTLRAWSTDHEEYDMGPGQVPVGVVEDDETGRCHSIYVERISFASAPPRGN